MTSIPPPSVATGISGTYHGGAGNPSPLTLRIELVGTEVIVSGDLPTGGVSFQCAAVPRPANDGDEMALVVVDHTEGRAAPPGPRVQIDADANPPVAVFRSGGTSWTCTRASGNFRRLRLTEAFDVGKRVVNVRHAGKGNGATKRSVPSELRAAGLETVLARPVKLESALASGAEGVIRGAWHIGEMRHALSQALEARNAPEWSVFLLHAEEFEDPNLVGIMFDNEDDNQRQGCAVSYQKLLEFYGTQSQAWREATLFACMHELGHCLNVLHRQDKSWMWDPFEGGAPEIFRESTLAFAGKDLHHLHHAIEENIIPGGDRFGGGSPALAAFSKQDRGLPQEDDPSAGLQLRVKFGKTDFFIGEPIFAEIRLSVDRNAVPPDREMSLYRPHPDNGHVHLCIRYKDGSRGFRPRWTKCEVPRTIPVHDDVRGLPWYESVYIGYGRDGFYFEAEGVYTIDASYHVAGRVIEAPSVEITMSFSAGPAAITCCRYWNNQVAELISMNGSRSPRLREGADRLRRIAEDAIEAEQDEDFPHHLAACAHWVRGSTATRPFVRRLAVPRRIDADDELYRVDSETAVKHLSTVTTREMAVQDRERRGVDNLRLNRSFRHLAEVLGVLQGDRERALDTLLQFESTFRGLLRKKGYMLKRIEADAADTRRCVERGATLPSV